MGYRNFFSCLCGCILLFCISSSLTAQTASSGFTLQQVLSAPFPTNLVAAEHAGRIAWVFDSKGESNVWVADAPDFKARQVTHYTGDVGMPLAALKLTPDGRTAVYVRGSETNQAGEVADPTSNVEKPLQQVWAVDVDAVQSAPRLIGEMGCNEEGCEDVEISPDGKFAVWAAKKQIWIAPVAGNGGDRRGPGGERQEKTSPMPTRSPSRRRRSPMRAGTIRGLNGRRMERRSRSSATGAITALLLSMNLGATRCVIFRRARTATAIRGGLPMAARSRLCDWWAGR